MKPFFLLICFVISGQSGSSGQQQQKEGSGVIVARFDGHGFEKITANGPYLFVSAGGQILRLDPGTLAQIQNVTVESPEEKSDYHCKVLLIDRMRKWLIVCGTHYRGGCTIHNLDNIRQILFRPNESVVADTEAGSTVAFLGPGPLSAGWAMYVAASWTSQYRTEIVATRSLEQSHLLHLVESGISSGTRLNIKSEIQGRFPLHYVFGFQSDGYSYFIVVRPPDPNNQKSLITKLVRICQQDKQYYSYTEIPLHCDSQSSNSPSIYAKAIAAHYFPSSLANDPKHHLAVLFVDPHSEDSAICIYSLYAINRTFNENIQKCFRGKGQQNINYIHSNFPPCQSTSMDFEYFSCGSDVNQQLDTNDPISSNPVIQISAGNQRPTSLFAKMIRPPSPVILLIVGTNQGSLWKYSWQAGRHMANRYGQIENELDSGPILPDGVIMVEQHRDAIVGTPKAIYRVAIQNCSNHRETCLECFSGKDPFCGWCSAKNRCSTRDECPEPNHWLDNDDGRSPCPAIIKVVPDSIQITTRKKIRIYFQNFRPSKQNLFCIFRFAQMKIYAPAKLQPLDPIVECPSPDPNELPTDLASQKHFVPATLIVAYRNPEIILGQEQPFRFYDCWSYQNCTDCVRHGQFQCQWCKKERSCKPSEVDCWDDNFIKTGADCPKVIPVDGKHREFFVHDGLPVQVYGTVQNFDIEPKATIRCKFKKESNSTLVVQAEFQNPIIRCESVFFSLPNEINEMEKIIPVEFEVDHHLLDNSLGITVVVYRCWALAPTCGQCLTLDSKYKCGWCSRPMQKMSACQIYDNCQPQPLLDDLHNISATWLNPDLDPVCPHIKIIDFLPKSGPITGGTMLQIIGQNFPLAQKDLEIRIRLIPGNTSIPCVDLRVIHTKKIYCLLNVSEEEKFSHGNSGPIVIRIRDTNEIVSEDNYRFVKPELSTVSPRKGPKSGGSMIMIHGQNLDTGSRVTVHLGSSDCYVTRRNSSTITCYTGRFTKTSWSNVDVLVRIDKSILKLPRTFRYLDDPIIVEIKANLSDKTVVDYPCSIPSGGILFEVHGERFDCIQQPQFYIELSEKIRINSSCYVISEKLMRCKTSSIPESKRHLIIINGNENFTELNFGFIMDNVTEVRSLALSSKFPPLRMYPQPKFYEFHDKPVYGKEYLTIFGEYLDTLKLFSSQVQIRIDYQHQCPIKFHDYDHIGCRLPSFSAHLNERDPKCLLPVNVSIGDSESFEQHLGRLDICHHGPNFLEWIIVFAALAILSFLVGIVLVLHCWKKNRQSRRKLKATEGEKEKLEMNVIKEVTEARLGLDFELPNMDNIPFNDYHRYVKNIFPIHYSSMNTNFTPGHYAIRDQDSLLKIISKLDNNNWITAIEKARFVRLLVLVLADDIEYLNEILFKLMDEFMKNENDDPRAWFRPTKSIVETLVSSWLTLLLYDHLRESGIGSAQYQMCQTLKFCCNYGPVDECTKSASYTLDDKQMLRIEIDYTILEIEVWTDWPEDNEDDEEENPYHYYERIPFLGKHQPYKIKVNDCDTISQVIEKSLDKIFEGRPFSERPFTIDDFKLILRDEQNNEKTLKDLDDSSEKAICDGFDYCRLNTLKHYGINKSDGLKFFLARKPKSNWSSSITCNTLPMMSLSSRTRTQSKIPAKKHYWHLEIPTQTRDLPYEMFSIRVFPVKNKIQKYVEQLFRCIYSEQIDRQMTAIPIKILFDYFDRQVSQMANTKWPKIPSEQISHHWKTNSLMLRFFMNIVQNPEYLLDIEKNVTLNGNYTVISSILMASCDLSQNIEQNPASPRSVFREELKRYKEWLNEWYERIRSIPSYSEEEVRKFYQSFSQRHKETMDSDTIKKAQIQLEMILEKYCKMEKKLDNGHSGKDILNYVQDD